jgi:hypothetical protein
VCCSKGPPHHWKFSKVHAGPLFAQGFQPSVCTIRLYNEIVQATSKVIQNHENEHVRCTGQGEARHRKCKRLQLDGVQAYNRSCD